MRLVIDDERTHRGKSVVHVRSSREALKWLRGDIVLEALYLDHDLGMGDHSPDTITPVVDYMCERAFDGDPIKVGVVYVHTQNPVGAQNIMRALNRHGYETRRIGVEEFL